MRNLNFPNHRWSGWPGAYCLYCGIDDPAEYCLANHPMECYDPKCHIPYCIASEGQKAIRDGQLDGA